MGRVLGDCGFLSLLQPPLFLQLLLPVPSRHLLVDEQHEANVWQDVNEVGSETLVKSPHSLVPVCVPYALEGAVVVTVLVLQARPDNLVGVRRYGGDELGRGGEKYVFGSSLKARTSVIFTMNSKNTYMCRSFLPAWSRWAVA